MSEKRELVMLAKESKGEEDISGWYWSEKLDGMRVLWDGGVSRDMEIGVVPWANLGKGDTALATGLWSRYGNPVYAPDWFLNALPTCILDGELFGGRGHFQRTMSACKKKKPIDEEWSNLSFKVFSTPQLQNLFRSGQIRNANFERYIFMDQCEEFFSCYASDDLHHLVTARGTNIPFNRELEYLESWLDEADPNIVSLHAQLKLPNDQDHAWEVANQKTKNILAMGGEGGIVRNHSAPWIPKRVSDLLKIVPAHDAEAIITGATSGRVGKTGKLHGLVGNFVVLYNGNIEFELSGFTDAERAINCPVAEAWAKQNPGQRFPVGLLNEGVFQFGLGQEITFTYKELTKAGVPKNARFKRVRIEE